MTLIRSNRATAARGFGSAEPAARTYHAAWLDRSVDRAPRSCPCAGDVSLQRPSERGSGGREFDGYSIRVPVQSIDSIADKGIAMGIGLGVFLLIAGAILAFGVKTSLTDFDLTTIGYILMAGGALVILLSLIVFLPRGRRARSTAVTTDSAGRQAVVERDDRITGF